VGKLSTAAAVVARGNLARVAESCAGLRKPLECAVGDDDRLLHDHDRFDHRRGRQSDHHGRLGTGYDAVVWVTSAYLLGYAWCRSWRRLGDRFGAKNLYLIGLVVFTVASMWCGLSGSVAC